MSKKEKIFDRIYTELKDSDPRKFLIKDISAADLQSLLLNVFTSRSEKLTPSEILTSYAGNRFCKSTTIPQKLFIEFDQIAYSVLPDVFEGIELSPVTTLGSVSAFARVHQNNTVATIRNTEVVSDATNVLTLEAALRRKKLSAEEKKSTQINLATSHRVLRAQNFDGPVSFAHFKIFSMISAGRDLGSFLFEKKSLELHLKYYFDLFRKLSESNYTLGKIHTKFIYMNNNSTSFKVNEIIAKLSEHYPGYKFSVEQNTNENFTYYCDLRFQIYIEDKEEELLIVDGGYTDWTQQLLSDKKEKLFISGMGTERMIYCFSNKYNVERK